MIFALCEGGVESCEQIYIDDKLVTWSGTLTHGTERTVGSGDSNFYKDSDSKISVTWYDGRDDQTYNTTVGALSSWTSNHRLRGVSYLAFKFKWNQDCFMGIPDVKAVIKGRKVFEPRTSTTEFSSNSALCSRDYLLNTKLGLVATSTEVNDKILSSAANTCDENVTLAGGRMEKR